MDNAYLIVISAGCSWIASSYILPMITDARLSRLAVGLFTSTTTLSFLQLVLFILEISSSLDKAIRHKWWSLILWASVLNVLFVLPFAQLHLASTKSPNGIVN